MNVFVLNCSATRNIGDPGYSYSRVFETKEAALRAMRICIREDFISEVAQEIDEADVYEAVEGAIRSADAGHEAVLTNEDSGLVAEYSISEVPVEK